MTVMESNLKKSRTVSFRVPDNLIADIEKEAKTSLISSFSIFNSLYANFPNHTRVCFPFLIPA